MVVAGAVVVLELVVVIVVDAIIGPPPVKLSAPTTLLMHPSSKLSAPVNVEQGERSRMGDVEEGGVVGGTEGDGDDGDDDVDDEGGVAVVVVVMEDEDSVDGDGVIVRLEPILPVLVELVVVVGFGIAARVVLLLLDPTVTGNSVVPEIKSTYVVVYVFPLEITSAEAVS